MSESPPKPLRILLIEDSDEDAFILLRDLRKANYAPLHKRVETEESLTQAIRNLPWDIVLCDNSMPALTGRRALELVGQVEPAIPFLFLSGSDRPPKGTHPSSIPFIQKGDRPALLAAIAKALSGSPLPAVSRPSEPVPAAPLPAPAASGGIASPKLLMVDDRPENLNVLAAVLAPLGSILVRAESGEAALECLLKEDFALILLDVRMPGMGGFETANLIHQRARNQSIPIIFLTAGSDDPGEILRGYDSGGVDYLTKPFVPEILKAKVSVFLELWRKNSLLERQAAELRSANESLDAFTSSASHDLKVPLRAIEAFSRILCEDYEGKFLDGPGTEYARRISHAARRMKTLTEDLLTFARLGRSEIALVPLDLTELVDALLPELQDGSDAPGGRILVQRPLGKALAHPLLLRQALTNLVTNALKFSPPGQSPEVSIRSVAGANRIRLRVEDRGIGMSLAQQEKLFKPFVRLENAKSYPGTGLGLAIVKKAVERMEGQVGVESTLGKGSSFSIDLRLPA